MPSKPTNKQRRDSAPEFTPTLGYTLRKWSLVVPVVMLAVTLVGSFVPEQRDSLIDTVFTAVDSPSRTNHTQ